MSPLLKDAVLNWSPPKLSQLDQFSGVQLLYPGFRDRMFSLLMGINKLKKSDGLADDCMDKDFSKRGEHLNRQLTACLKEATIPTVYLPVLTMVGPRNQASRYVKGRIAKEVDTSIQQVTRLGAALVGRWIMDAKAGRGQETTVLTSYLPGDSWHQWGLECDVVPFVWSKTEPSRRVRPNNPALYDLRIEREVEGYGLFAGGGVVKHVRYVHEDKASKCFSWTEIQRQLLKRFEFSLPVSADIGKGTQVNVVKERKEETINEKETSPALFAEGRTSSQAAHAS